MALRALMLSKEKPASSQAAGQFGEEMPQGRLLAICMLQFRKFYKSHSDRNCLDEKLLQLFRLMFHARPIDAVCQRVTAIAVSLLGTRNFPAGTLGLFHDVSVKHYARTFM